MSMAEALKSLRGKVPWLREDDSDPFVVPKPKTPVEDADELLLLTKQGGLLDKSSPTWAAVSKWAAQEIIVVQRGLETFSGERADALRARSRTLRDLLEMDKPDHLSARIEDIGPNIP